MTQCHGITARGLRCRRRVGGDYCQDHDPAKRSKITAFSALKTEPLAPKPGYIYVYTLTSLASGKGGLKARNLPSTLAKNRQKWTDFPFKGPYTLIKVGMTTQTVQKRLSQWEQKCGHQLTVLGPSRPEPKMLLVARMALLCVLEPPVKNYASWRDGGFYTSHNVAATENRVHVLLRLKYGRGDVLCTGCRPESSGGSWLPQERGKTGSEAYGIHVEWFLVPKENLSSVYEMIDQECLK